MKRKIMCCILFLLWAVGFLYTQASNTIDPYEMTAISVSGRKVYVTEPILKVLEYDIVYTLKNALWDGSVFTAHRNGLFVVTVSFVKDAYYHNGTQDDVYVTVYKEDISGVRTSMGLAWSGEGTGKRGTGTYTVVAELLEGEKILTVAHAAKGDIWNLELFNLTIYSLPNYVY
ncbi:MAG: hypothetical protein JXB88_12595 [Spirochaetales bacterium]|nr:hypothetical protein [Spirochaetales bacterium]